MELVIERDEGSNHAIAHITLDDDSPTVAADAVALASSAGGDVDVWIHGATEARDALMVERGFESNRALLQLRRPLPAAPTDLVTRPVVDADIEELVSVNNRAFAWHPEQGGLSVERIRAQMSESWFVAAGLRILERDNRIAGFCWTKIHYDPEYVGEIYVIGLDPDFAGQGLGGPLTLAGLSWLTEAGVDAAMLYVEADNEPARKVYDRLGFTLGRVDRLWQRRREP